MPSSVYGWGGGAGIRYLINIPSMHGDMGAGGAGACMAIVCRAPFMIGWGWGGHYEENLRYLLI